MNVKGDDAHRNVTREGRERFIKGFKSWNFAGCSPEEAILLKQEKWWGALWKQKIRSEKANALYGPRSLTSMSQQSRRLFPLHSCPITTFILSIRSSFPWPAQNAHWENAKSHRPFHLLSLWLMKPEYHFKSCHRQPWDGLVINAFMPSLHFDQSGSFLRFSFWDIQVLHRSKIRVPRGRHIGLGQR
jgi:hypothetical protein